MKQNNSDNKGEFENHPLLDKEDSTTERKPVGIFWRAFACCMRSYSQRVGQHSASIALLIYSTFLAIIAVILYLENGFIYEVVQDYTNL